MVIYISAKLFTMGSQKFTRLLVLPFCTKKPRQTACCQIELHYAHVMTLSDAVIALWK